MPNLIVDVLFISALNQRFGIFAISVASFEITICLVYYSSYVRYYTLVYFLLINRKPFVCNFSVNRRSPLCETAICVLLICHLLPSLILFLRQTETKNRAEEEYAIFLDVFTFFIYFRRTSFLVPDDIFIINY